MIDITKLTPAQRQYVEIKNQYKDCILFFRMWDFYETFYEDAKLCSKLLDIALTSRDRSWDNPIPMAWVPYHSVDKYLGRLVKAGHKVAIAEQIGEVKPGQIVQREVLSIATPGTYMDDKDDKKYNFIAWIYSADNYFHISWWDFSIWEYFTKSFSKFEALLSRVVKLQPSEIILDINFEKKEELKTYISMYLNALVNIFDIPYDVNKFLLQILNVQTLTSYGQALEQGRQLAIGLLFNYLKDTQKTSLKNISKISFVSDENKVIFDETTIRNLEVLKSSYEWDKKYSLLWVVDNTNTSIGSRKIYDIILNPINDLDELNKRFLNIEYYFQNQDLSKNIIDVLKSINDIPRVISSLLYRKNIPVTWNKLKITLRNLFSGVKWEVWSDKLETIHELSLQSLVVKELIRIWVTQETINNIKNFYWILESALKDEWEYSETDYIKDWFNNEIDELRKIAYHSDDLLIRYQQKLIQETWINWIRLKYINNQWYFIEVSKKDSELLEKKIEKGNPEKDFMRRQTLKIAERYKTTYLEELEIKIISAKSQLDKLEKAILEKLKNDLENIYNDFSTFSDHIWWLDVYSSFGKFSYENKWIKPILNQSYDLKITWWRHPVIEKYLPMWEHFIPNDLNMKIESWEWRIENWKKNNWDWFVHIITWPNMWWKSTFLRQNAIIVLLSHCGFFVPAEKVEIGLLDWIFARVGSWDILAKNQSTFMTEMIEVANILNNATQKSFVILDELGRWTSTYDGMAIAKSIVEFIATNIKAKTLFATHYHELIQLENNLKWVKNYSVSVYETEKEVVFMKKIVKWWANKSYWIDVAQIAWLPKEILENARKSLQQLENWKMCPDFSGIEKWKDEKILSPLFEISDNKSDKKLEKYNQLKNYLDNVDINNMTPLSALDLLNKLKNL